MDGVNDCSRQERTFRMQRFNNLQSNDLFAHDTVEKLRFEISGDFICDLSVILYVRHEGGSRSPMKIQPDARQKRTIDL
jgi:hypothetical protein